jgi:catechol 2,3-dioxygenase-like lactoylglutathione lyase family enzyme
VPFDGEPTASKPTVGSADLCIVVESTIAEVLTELRELGVAIIAGPVERTGALGAMQSLYFADPDGNLLEVSSYGEGRE